MSDSLPSVWLLVSETQIAGSIQTQPDPVNQSQSVPIAVSSLRDVPAVVRCPYCGHVGATKITYMPGRLAWCICILVMLIGGWDSHTHTSMSIWHQSASPGLTNPSSVYAASACLFQVFLRFLSDSFNGAQPSRCTSFLHTVWTTTAHVREMTLSAFIRLLISSGLPTTPKTSQCDTFIHKKLFVMIEKWTADCG